MKLFVIAGLVVTAGSIAQAHADGAAGCDGSTYEMVQCMNAKSATQVKKIEATTKKIFKILDARKNSGDGTPEDYEQAKAELLKSNKAAAEAIFSQCSVEATLETVTGSLGKLVYSSCEVTELTKRSEVLKRILKESEAGQ